MKRQSETGRATVCQETESETGRTTVCEETE